TGWRYLLTSSLNSPANPPSEPSTSGRRVRCTWDLSRSTACSPAWMETPASAYVTVRFRPPRRRAPRPLPPVQGRVLGSRPPLVPPSAPEPRSVTCVTVHPLVSSRPAVPRGRDCPLRGQRPARGSPD